MPNSPRNQVLGLIGWLAVCFGVAALGGFASASAPAFYAELQRPSWSPPAWVFGPVWTLLFALMGIAAWLVWREKGFADARVALGLFIAQLVANALWSWLFFAWQLGTLSLVDIAILWALILATIVAFWPMKPLAGVLLLPYLGWVSFAAALNFALCRLNPELLP